MSSANSASPPATSVPAGKHATTAAHDAVLTPRRRASTRVAILDEPGIMRDGLCALLTAADEFEIVAVMAEAAELQGIVEGPSPPDVIIIDFSHASSTGHDVIATAKACRPAVRVLVLTFRKDDNIIDSALRAGADGYVLKNDSRNDLYTALRNIAAGRGYISPSICDRVMSGYVRARDPTRARTVTRGELTERERQVMQLIAAGHRTREMAGLLSLSHKTVEKHRANLMRKLGLRNASAVAAYAIANGFVNF